jgi:two-component system, OmpR family, response regulator
MSRILIVEDDVTMAGLLADGLRADGHEATVVGLGAAALLAATETDFDLIASDVMLPDIDGFEVCRQLRAWNVRTPIIVLTARDSVEDRVRGLDFGADDYLVKPFAFVEFAARVRALLRRPSVPTDAAIRAGNVRLDATTGTVTANDTVLSLSRREFGVLRVLLARPGEVTARDVILDEVWGTVFVDPTIVDQYIRYVRRKLSAAAADVSIETLRGVGYRLVVES